MPDENTIMIKFEGGSFPIDGESVVEGFLKQLEAQSFQEAFSNPRSTSGLGQAAGRTSASDISISSVPSVHSNLLRKSMFENNCIATVTISFLKMVGTKNEVYDVRTYKNAYVTSYAMSKSGPMDMESWSFQATEYQASYKTQDPTTHQLTEASTSTLNLAASTTA